MFKKNQSNWNFSINIVMYSCITIRAGSNRTCKMERIAKMVNILSRWIFAWGSVLVVLLVLNLPLLLFIQRRYFILAPERLNIFFSFFITNCFNNCYTAFPWLPVSNILDFKFYCNRIFFYFENDLRWKRSKY